MVLCVLLSFLIANSIYSKLSEQKIKFTKQCFFFNSVCVCVCSSSQVKFPLFLQWVLDSGLINWVTCPFGRGTGEQHRSNGAWMKKVTKSEFFKGPIWSNNYSLCSSYFRINSIYPRLHFFLVYVCLGQLHVGPLSPRWNFIPPGTLFVRRSCWALAKM